MSERTMEVGAGQRIDMAAKSAQEIADSSGDNVRFEFNGHWITATPGGNVHDMLRPYWAAAQENERRYERRRQLESKAAEIVQLIAAAIDSGGSLSPFLVGVIRQFAKDWETP